MSQADRQEAPIPGVLAVWLSENIEGYSGPARIRRFPGGQSNPTFRIDTPDKAYVVRRKPEGELLPSAHAIDREFRVMKAIGQVGFPAPEVLAYCSDDRILGSEFFVMEMVEGEIYWGVGDALDPAARRVVFESMITTLARLHAIDPATVGLADYGRPGNYFGRQVARWARQYAAGSAAPVHDIDRLIAWLPTCLPLEGAATIVHGDFRLDNLIFAADGSGVSAVLDWELSTLGDPLADLTYLLMNWVAPAEATAADSGFADRDREALGIPDLESAIQLYETVSGRTAPRRLEWYFAYNLFRLACIFHGIASRVLAGNAASDQAALYANRVEEVAAAGWRFAERAQASLPNQDA